MNVVDFKKHQKIHLGDNPFSCEICGKLFTLQCSLKRHMLLHKEAVRFHCDHCLKNFTTEGDLERHICRKAHRKVSKV